jgi:hypothetical protein
MGPNPYGPNKGLLIGTITQLDFLDQYGIM